MAARTEPATPRRLREARARGASPRAPSAVAVAALAGGVLAAGTTLARLRTVFTALFSLSLRVAAGVSAPRPSPARVLGNGLAAIVPVLLAAAGCAVLATGVQTRFLVTVPSGGKRGPSRAWGSAGAALIRGAALLVVGAVVARGALTAAPMAAATPGALAARAMTVGRAVSLRLLAIAAVLAAVDVALAVRRYTRDLRMTRAEVTRERRDDEGAPEVRGARAEAASALADGHGTHTLARATRVLTDHGLALALRYAPDEADAPVLLARARGTDAGRLLADAERAGVPVTEAPAAVHALRTAVVGRPIPEAAYEAVAAVVAGVVVDGVTAP